MWCIIWWCVECKNTCDLVAIYSPSAIEIAPAMAPVIPFGCNYNDKTKIIHSDSIFFFCCCLFFFFFLLFFLVAQLQISTMSTNQPREYHVVQLHHQWDQLKEVTSKQDYHIALHWTTIEKWEERKRENNILNEPIINTQYNITHILSISTLMRFIWMITIRLDHHNTTQRDHLGIERVVWWSFTVITSSCSCRRLSAVAISMVCSFSFIRTTDKNAARKRRKWREQRYPMDIAKLLDRLPVNSHQVAGMTAMPTPSSMTTNLISRYRYHHYLYYRWCEISRWSVECLIIMVLQMGFVVRWLMRVMSMMSMMSPSRSVDYWNTIRKSLRASPSILLAANRRPFITNITNNDGWRSQRSNGHTFWFDVMLTKQFKIRKRMNLIV